MDEDIKKILDYINREIRSAESAIATEQLAGNEVKEIYNRSRQTALRSVKAFIENEILRPF